MAGNPMISVKLMLTGLVVALLYMSAQKSREAIGVDNLSRTEDLSWQDCLDWGSGSVACAGKQLVKLYTFNIRGSYVEKARQRAYEIGLNKGIADGLGINAAQDKATKLGKEAGKFASRKHKRITGPIISGAWDFFEVLYYGGTLVEGAVKGAGTLAGTYFGGGLGEQWLNWPSTRIGFLLGSQMGSWLGGEVGLMVYDVCNGARLLSTSLSEFFSGTAEISPETPSTFESTDWTPQATSEDPFRSESMDWNTDTTTDSPFTTESPFTTGSTDAPVLDSYDEYQRDYSEYQ